MIYLDSAATTLQKPQSVAWASARAIQRLASPGRGGHRPAMAAAETAFACRQAAAELFHVPSPEQVVFTFNATHGLNMAIHTLVKPAGSGGSSDPLDQITTVGWKVAGFAAKVLQPTWLIRIEHGISA